MRIPILLLSLGLVLLPARASAAPVLTRPPELVQFVEAEFPPSETGHTAAVVLAVTLRDDGTVEDVTVQESAGEAFDAAAVAAVRQFVFTPAEVDGKPSRIRILYRYEFVERAAVPTTAVFAGVVMDREAKVPLPGVRVTLGDGRVAETDAEGRFEFADVAPGTATVTLEGERLTALSTEETFVAGERLDATYEVFLAEEGEAVDDMEILVTAPTIKREAVSTVIAADEARKVPGTQGDVLRVVENLPGVARASLGTGSLVVWGAAPEDTGVYVDGVPVPRLYHDGGLRSVVGSSFVRSVELVPGGYGAEYGRGLGGLVSVETGGFDEAWHGELAADVYDGAAAVGGPLGERVDVGLAGRYGWVGPLLSAVAPEVEDYFPIPHYWDAQGRVGLSLGPSRTLRLTGLASSDATRRAAPNPDPARAAEEEKTLRFERVSLAYDHDLGDGAQVSALLYGGMDRNAQVARYGPIETSVVTGTRLVGARGAYRSRVLDTLTAEAGVDALVQLTDVARRGSVALPAREGDVRVFGQPPPDQLSVDAFDVATVDVAPYGEADLSLWKDRLHLLPGLRFDPYARSVSNALPVAGGGPTHGVIAQDPHLEPRLTVRLAPSERVFVLAAGGRYAQQPAAADLSASFGNPTLPASTGTQALLGGGWTPWEPLSIEATVFYSRTEGLAMRNAAEQPSLAEALLPTGSGRTYGAQAMAKLAPVSGVYGWLSYTLAWSERRDAEGSDWRPSDYDQRHVLTALGGYELPFAIELGVRARVATGFPRTEVVGAVYDSRRDLYQPVFGEHNELRLPTFFQADLRVARSFELRTSQVDLSLEVQNLTNRANVEEFIYNADYTEQGGIRGLPVLPVFGARWSF